MRIFGPRKGRRILTLASSSELLAMDTVMHMKQAVEESVITVILKQLRSHYILKSKFKRIFINLVESLVQLPDF